ncbi:MAG TPA: SAF domain-containing protein [Solirubrobacterales bacterium]|nr:SAF domain-containing protein [Solirubrobacterales bacterium]
MSRRARAVSFLLAAAIAAVAAAALAEGYGESVVRGYGRLRPVVVATADLPPGEELGPEAVAEDLEVRQVPVRFVPPPTLADPAEAIGLVAAARVPAGSYLLATQLRSPRARPAGALGRDRRPVEIAVAGVGALTALGVQPVGSEVDVVVTTEPSGSGDGRSYVAAAAVPLLGLGGGGEGTPGEALVTLGLTRGQALRLLAAESFARRITVIPAL